MKWITERDHLIAQTMAFVQSVTGKSPDAQTPGVDAYDSEPRYDREPPCESKPRIEAVSTGAVRIALEIVEQPIETPQLIQIAPAPVPVQILRTGVQSELQNEIASRVANFRAHQERFHREREEYFRTTFAKARASIGDKSSPEPRRK